MKQTQKHNFLKRLQSFLTFFSPQNRVAFAGMLISILLIAMGLRLYKINTPLADWHSWRQVDTASVSREFIRYDRLYPDESMPTLLVPRYHDLSNIPSGLDNLEGYRMVEFPLINYVVAKIVTVLPNPNTNETLVQTYRLTSVFFSVAAIGIITIIVKKLSNQPQLALLTALVLTFMPYAIFYNRTILPEVSLTFFMYAAVLSFMYWLESYQQLITKKKITQESIFSLVGLGVLTWILLAISFLIKPIAIFMAPVYILLAIWQLGLKQTLLAWPLWIFATSIVPLLAWRTHITEYPSGIAANSWLFNGNGIRLKPSWWRWLFGERIGQQILGIWGTTLAVVGLTTAPDLPSPWQRLKTLFGFQSNLSLFDGFTLALTAGWFSYLVVFATGNVQHDYYQIPLIPVLALLVARGIMTFYALLIKQYSSVVATGIIIAITGLSLFLSADIIRGYYQINNPAIVAAGAAVQAHTNENALVIAPYMGDTAFLFQTNRRGWPIGFEIDEKIALGATHYVSTAYDDEARELETRFVTIEKNDQYILLDLTQSL